MTSEMSLICRFLLSRRHSFVSRALLVSSFVILVSSFSFGDDAQKVDSRYPFRIDGANETLPWYQLKPGEFPPHHSDHRIGGSLVSVDFLHRSGVFREDRSGQLVNFTMPPFGGARYLNADASLRDIPLGVQLTLFLHPDETGAFTKVTDMLDDFTVMASHNFTWRLDELKLDEGKLLVNKQNLSQSQTGLGQGELLVNGSTRVWKDDQQIKLTDLAVGDALIANRAARTGSAPGPCADIWVGVETQKRATEEQRARHSHYLKLRGLAGWIDHVETGNLVVTLFSTDDRSVVQGLFNPNDFPVGQDVWIAATDEDLRLYDHHIDSIRGQLVKVETAPTDCYGSSGIRLVLKPSDLLEAFRPAGLVRIFGGKWSRGAHSGEGALLGESLGGYRLVHSFECMKLLPDQFPFRTDFGNESLSWYQLKPGVIPPPFSEHRVTGELLQVDAAKNCGQFRADRTGELVNFTLLPTGGRLQRTLYTRMASPLRFEESVASVLCLNAPAKLADLSPGTRCHFYLYQDETGAFTKASLVMDDYTALALNYVTYRIEELHLDEGKIYAARHLPLIKDYQGDPSQPLDSGRTELFVDGSTRVWKEGQQIKLSDLALGDDLLVNLTGETATTPSRCTDLWVGTETHNQVTAAQQKSYEARR